MPYDRSVFRRRLVTWYRRNRRDLPWRPPPGSPPRARPHPYHVLVSEIMLQQTRVETVVPYFRRFIAELPTLAHLAGCDEQRVLRLWQGLGYYSRARNLLRAAAYINACHGGVVPRKAADLKKIDGIGPYTAGAIASIAYDEAEPVLDGNVARVLCRLHALRGDPKSPPLHRKLWDMVKALVPTRGAGEFNSALMELGATVCLPRSPQCPACPLRSVCQANAQKLQDQIPSPHGRKRLSTEIRWTFCIWQGARWLLEQRPASGRWAGMWQFPTVPAQGRRPTLAVASRLLGLPIVAIQPLTTIRHALTHRQYMFEVFTGQAGGNSSAGKRKWLSIRQINRYPLPAVHARLLALIGKRKGRENTKSPT